MLPIFIPQILQGKSQTVVQPMLPIFVKADLHGSNTAVGLIAAAYPIAAIGSSMFLGVILQRCHFAVSSLIALAVLATTGLISAFVPSVAVFFMVRLCGGVANTAFDLSRKAFLAAEVPKSLRARITSLQAGMSKVAVMVAALLSGVVAQHLETRSVFFVQASFTLCALLALLTHELMRQAKATRAESASANQPGSGTNGGSGSGSRSGPANGVAPIGLRTVMRQEWRSFVGAGLYSAMLNGIRGSWNMALPLHGHQLGLSKQTIGFVVACFRGCDAVMNLTLTGHIVDRYGRSRAAIPSMLLFSLAMFLLPMTESLGFLLLVVVIYAGANGLSGGVINFFATSLAPAHARTQFLGIWKTVTSLGDFVLPPIFGAIADWTGSLKASCFFTAAYALFGLVWLLCVVRPDHEEPSNARDRPASNSNNNTNTAPLVSAEMNVEAPSLRQPAVAAPASAQTA